MSRYAAKRSIHVTANANHMVLSVVTNVRPERELIPDLLLYYIRPLE